MAIAGIHFLDILSYAEVLPGIGKGQFSGRTFVRTAYVPGALAVADFRDGKLDAVVLPSNGSPAAFSGDGFGNLIAEEIYGAGAGAWQNMVAGEFRTKEMPGWTFTNASAETFCVVENVNRISNVTSR